MTTWDLTHNPDRRPLGCNGKYGRSGAALHERAGEPVCKRCRNSINHYKRERRRGQLSPRKLQPCGTKAAAVRHRKKGEPLCFPCRIAEAAEKAERERKKAMDVHQS